MDITNNITLSNSSYMDWHVWDTLNNREDYEWFRDTYVLPWLVAGIGPDWRNISTEFEQIICIRKAVRRLGRFDGVNPYPLTSIHYIRNMLEYMQTAGNYVFCTTFNSVFQAALLVIGVPSVMCSIHDAYVGDLFDDNMMVWSSDHQKWHLHSAIYNCYLADSSGAPMDMVQLYEASRNSAISVTPIYDDAEYVEEGGAGPFGPESSLWDLARPVSVNAYGVGISTRMCSDIAVWKQAWAFDNLKTTEGADAAYTYKPAGVDAYTPNQGTVTTDPLWFRHNINSLHIATVDNGGGNYTTTLTHNMPSAWFRSYQRRYQYVDGIFSEWVDITSPYTDTPDASVANIDFRAVNQEGY